MTELSPRIYVRGLVIDIQDGEDGVQNVIVNTQKNQHGTVGRICQCLSNAIHRIADTLDLHQNGGALRVFLVEKSGAPVNHQPTYLAHTDIREVFPLCVPNGQAKYVTLLIHECPKRHHDGRLIGKGGWFGRKKSADDAHGEATWLKPGILPFCNLEVFPAEDV